MFSRIPNLQVYEFFSQFFSYFLLKQGSRIDIKKCIYNYLFSLCSTFKRKQEMFRKKNRRFGIRENMSRTGYKSLKKGAKNYHEHSLSNIHYL
jgi:hypothetical protein